MMRMFGSNKGAPKATLRDTIDNLETRVENLDVKIKKLDTELQTYSRQLNKMRDGPGKNAIKQKAFRIIRERKTYETQRDQLREQSMNLERTEMLQDNVKNSVAVLSTMKTATKELERQTRQFANGKAQDIMDQNMDMQMRAEEIMEELRPYNVPDFDEDELEAELEADLEAMREESALEAEMGSSEVPAFMRDEVGPPQFVDEPPDTVGPNPLKETAS